MSGSRYVVNRLLQVAPTHWHTPEDYSGVDSGSLEVPTLVIHVGMLWPLDSVAVSPQGMLLF